MDQRSSVRIGKREVTVVSSIILDPEVLVLTRVFDEAGAVLRKQHQVVPAMTASEVARRGPEAATADLRSTHLRFVTQLLSAGPQRPSPADCGPLPAGVLARLNTDASGHVVEAVGEHQVPDDWQSAARDIITLARRSADRVGLGPLTELAVAGPGLAVLATDGKQGARLGFYDPERVEGTARVRELLETP